MARIRAARAGDEGDAPPVAVWMRNFRLSGFALTVLVLVAAAIVILAPGLKTFIEQRQQIAQLEREVEAAEQEVGRLEDELARWDDPAYVEAQARDRLYYVYPGDLAYIVINADGLPAADDGPPVSDEIQTTEVDWLAGLLSSLLEAGLTDAPPAELDGRLESPSQG